MPYIAISRTSTRTMRLPGRGVTTDTALRLARYFRTSPELWLGIQARYDIEVARRTSNKEIEAIKPRESESRAC